MAIDQQRLDEIDEALEKLAERFGTTTEVLAGFIKANKRNSQEFAKSIRDLERNIKKGTAGYQDQLRVLDQLTDSIDDLDDQINQSRDATERAVKAEEKRILVEQKMELQRAATIQGVTEITADAFTKTATALIKGTGSLIKSLQDGASAATAGSVALNMLVDTGATAAKGLGSLTSLGGTALALLSPWKKVGMALAALGIGVETASEGVSNLVKFGIDFLTKELDKTVESMKTLTAMGASFSGGMTEIRTSARASGLSLGTFVKSIENAQDSLRAVGVTGTESAGLLRTGLGKLGQTVKQVGQVQISTRDQLLNLGIAYEDQGKVLGLYMAQQKLAGKNLVDVVASPELTTGVKEYAKNLKILTDYTGKDAAKIMERAQAESARGALIGVLNADQQKSFQDAFSAMEAMPGEMAPKIQLALSQMLAGKAVSDPIIAGNQYVMDMLSKTADGVRQGNTDMLSATRNAMISAGKAQTAMGERQTDLAKLYGVSDPIVTGFADLGNALILMGQASFESSEQSKNSAEAQMNTTDELTIQYSQAVRATENFKSNLEDLGTKWLPAFSTSLQTVISEIDGALAKLVPGYETLNPQEDSVGKEIAGYIGTTVGAIVGGVLASPTLVGIGVGAAGGGMVGQTVAEGAYDYFTKPGKAKGGISSGPISGYSEILHGTEAVVPLPDNRSIPVKLDSGSITTAMADQTAMLREILSAMQANNNINGKILQNSY